MSKRISVAESRPTKVRAPHGKTAGIAIVAATRIVSLVTVVVAYYLIAFFAAVRVVPLTMGIVKSGSGVTMDMPVETVIAVWVVPSLFLVALLFTLVLFTMRSLWRLRSRALKLVILWAFGEEIEDAPIAAPVEKKIRHKTTTKLA